MLSEIITWPHSTDTSNLTFLGHVYISGTAGRSEVVGVFDGENDHYISGPHKFGDAWTYHQAKHFTPSFWAAHRVYRYACPRCGKPVYPPFEMKDAAALVDFLKPYGGGCSWDQEEQHA
jgi:hypothetical protein